MTGTLRATRTIWGMTKVSANSYHKPRRYKTVFVYP